MKKNKTQQVVFCLILILFLSMGLSACKLDTAGVQAWADLPPNGMESPVEEKTAVIETTLPTLNHAPTVIKTATATNIQKVEGNLQAEKMVITKGLCTRLSWSVKNARQQHLDGQYIPPVGEWQVCPESTTTYWLQASNNFLGKKQVYTVTITVKEPTDASIPPVPQTWVPQDGLSIGCKAPQNLLWLPVVDTNPIIGYFVQVKKWVSPGTYQLVQTYGPIVENQLEIPIDSCETIYIWRVRALNNAGKYSNWSNWSGIEVGPN